MIIPCVGSSAFSGNGSFNQVIRILNVRLPSGLGIASPDISLAIDVQIDFSAVPGEVAEHASKALGLRLGVYEAAPSCYRFVMVEEPGG